VKETLAANIETALTEVDGIPMDEIDVRLEELQKALQNVANSKGNYDSITDEIYRLREMKQNAMADSAERKSLKLRIDEKRQFLDEQTESIKEYDEKLTRRLIEKITVYEDHSR
jgi:site-specific DNA recombinase